MHRKTVIDSEVDINGHPAQSETPRRILLVEDNVDNQLLFRAYLKKVPCQLELAENGLIGVEKFQSVPYDLVLMDMQMPVMDGYTATQLIRQWEKDQRRRLTPIVALTANSLCAMAEKALEVGCTAYFTKPVPKETFIKLIVEYTGGREL